MGDPVRRPVNDPGLDGYLLAWAVSVGLVAATTGVIGFTSGEYALRDSVAIACLYGWFTAIGSVPFACAGIPLVHLACRRVSAQWVHVLTAGVAGVVPAAVMMTWEPPAAAWLWGVIPVATAIGRWSVVPLVTRRRRTPLRPGAPAAR